MLNEELETANEDRARLRKELEAALETTDSCDYCSWEGTHAGLIEHCKAEHPESKELARLRAFSEDQAQQMGRLENEFGDIRERFAQQVKDDSATIARLTRELERAKRTR